MRKIFLIWMVVIFLVFPRIGFAQQELPVEVAEEYVITENPWASSCENLGGKDVCNEFQECAGASNWNTSDYGGENCCNGTCVNLPEQEAVQELSKIYGKEEAEHRAEEYYKKSFGMGNILIAGLALVAVLILIFIIYFMKRKKKQFAKAGVMALLFCFLILFSPALASAQDSFRFAVISDTHRTPVIPNVGAITSTSPAFIIHDGDFTISNRLGFDEYNQFSGIPMLPEQGNHDASGQYRDFWQDKKPSGITFTDAAHWPFYYSFDYGNYHFIALSYSGNSLSSELSSWLQSDLSKNSNKQTILYSHLPAVGIDCVGGTGLHHPGDKISGLKAIIDKNSQVKVVIAGHNHCYDKRDIGNGVIQVTVGTAAADIRIPVGAPSDYPAGKHLFVTFDASPSGLNICPRIIEDGGKPYNCQGISGEAQPVKLPPCGTGPQALMYHTVKDSPSGQWEISTSDFKAQMKYLADNKCSVVSADDYVQRIKNGDKSQAILLTFDDRERTSHFTTVLPILKQYGFKGLFFVQSKKSGLTTAQLKEMIAEGMTIGSHSVDHPIKSSNNMRDHPSTADYELGQSKKDLESELGVPIKYFAWPGNIYDQKSTETAKKYYEGIFAVAKEVSEGGKIVQKMMPTTSQYEMFRREIGNSCGIDLFGRAVSEELCCIPSPSVDLGKVDISACVPYAPIPTQAAGVTQQFQNCVPSSGDVYGGGQLNLNLDAQGLAPIPDTIYGQKVCYDDKACFGQPGDCCKLKDLVIKQLYPVYKLFSEKGCTLKVTSSYRSQEQYKENWEASHNSATNCAPAADGTFWHCPHAKGWAVDVWADCPAGVTYEDKIKMFCEAGWVNYHHEAWHFEYGSDKWKDARAKDPRLCQWPITDSVIDFSNEQGATYKRYSSHKAIVLDKDQITDPTSYITGQPASTPSAGEQKPPAEAAVPSAPTGAPIDFRQVSTSAGRINIIDVDPNFFDIRLLSSKTIIEDIGGQQCPNYKGAGGCYGNIVTLKQNIPGLNIVAGVNAGFFDTSGEGGLPKDAVSDYVKYGRPVEDYVENGKLVKGKKDPGMYFIIDNGVPKIVADSEFSYTPSISYAVRGTRSEGSGPRTAICITSDGKIKLITSQSVDVSKLYDYLKTSENCAQAMHFDGGGSTQYYYEFGGQKFQDAGREGRPVANFLVIAPKGGMAYGSSIICPPGYAVNSAEDEILYAAYNVLSSFEVKVSYNFSDFDSIVERTKTVFEECKASAGSDIVNCLSGKLNAADSNFDFYFKKQGEITPSGAKKKWNDYCEDADTEFLNDLAEFYQDCRDSYDTQECACRFPYGNYPDVFKKTGSKIEAAEVSTKIFRAATDDLVAGNTYSIAVEAGDYNTNFPKSISSGFVFEFPDGSKLTSPVLVKDRANKKLSFASDLSLGKCTVQNMMIRVCAVSKKEVDGRNLTFRFALQTQDLPPPPVEGVAAGDVPRKSGLVMINWTKSPASDVTKYRIFFSNSEFQGTDPKILQPAKEIDLAAAIKVYEILGARFICEAGCGYELSVKYTNDPAESPKKISINPESLVFEEKTLGYHYLYSAADDQTNYYGITAVDRKNQQSERFLNTPDAKSVDDVPPGKVIIAETPSAANSYTLRWNRPVKKIDQSELKPDVGLQYEIYSKCPGEAGYAKILTVGSAEPVKQTAENCEYRIIAQRYSKETNWVPDDSEIDKGLIEYLEQ